MLIRVLAWRFWNTLINAFLEWGRQRDEERAHRERLLDRALSRRPKLTFEVRAPGGYLVGWVQADDEREARIKAANDQGSLRQRFAALNVEPYECGFFVREVKNAR